MVAMQRQQIELFEAVRRLTLPAVVKGATQTTASLSATTSVPTAELAGGSSSTTMSTRKWEWYTCVAIYVHSQVGMVYICTCNNKCLLASGNAIHVDL